MTVVIAFITTCFYIYFATNKTVPGSRLIDYCQMIIPNALAVSLVLILISSPYLIFNIEEFLRKHLYAGSLKYSGIETSIDKNIKDLVAGNTFQEIRQDASMRYNMDQRFLVGCWFTLSLPREFHDNCYKKVIQIKIRENKYGRIWDLSHPVYLLSSGVANEPGHIYDEFDGIVKYGYKSNITCISPGQDFKVLFLLKKNEGSLLSHQTWRYAISLKFSNE